MPRYRRAARLAATATLAAATAVASASCAKPLTKGDLDAVQFASDMAEAVNELRQSNADLRMTVDSLVIIVARQDTLLRQVAVVAGVPLPAPGIRVPGAVR